MMVTDSAIASRLVMNRNSAPPAMPAFNVAMPKPTTASGGIKAVAMATPTMVSPLRVMVA